MYQEQSAKFKLNAILNDFGQQFHSDMKSFIAKIATYSNPNPNPVWLNWVHATGNRKSRRQLLLLGTCASPPRYHICPFIILSVEKTTSWTPDKDTPTCLLIFLKLCMLKTKPNGSLWRSTGRASHCEHYPNQTSDSVSQGLVWTGLALSRVKVRKEEKTGEVNL